MKIHSHILNNRHEADQLLPRPQSQTRLQIKAHQILLTSIYQ